jgi:hypothetical protein
LGKCDRESLRYPSCGWSSVASYEASASGSSTLLAPKMFGDEVSRTVSAAPTTGQGRAGQATYWELLGGVGVGVGGVGGMEGGREGSSSQ